MHESFAIFNVLMWWRCDGKFRVWGEFFGTKHSPSRVFCPVTIVHAPAGLQPGARRPKASWFINQSTRIWNRLLYSNGRAIRWLTPWRVEPDLRVNDRNQSLYLRFALIVDSNSASNQAYNKQIRCVWKGSECSLFGGKSLFYLLQLSSKFSFPPTTIKSGISPPSTFQTVHFTSLEQFWRLFATVNIVLSFSFLKNFSWIFEKS